MSKRNKLRGKMDQSSANLDTAMYDNAELPESFVSNIDTRVEELLADNDMLREKVEELQAQNESGVVPTDSGSLLIQGNSVRHSRAHFSPTSMQIPKDLTQDEWAQIGHTLLSVKSSLSWYLGDWLIHGDSRWEGTYIELAEQFQYEIHTLETYASVCRKIHSSTRVETLSFAHHRYVTKYADPQVQQRLLLDAIEEKMSTRDFEKYIKTLDEDGNPIPILESPSDRKPSRIPKKFQSFSKSWTAQQYNRMNANERTEFRQILHSMLEQMDKWDNS